MRNILKTVASLLTVASFVAIGRTADFNPPSTQITTTPVMQSNQVATATGTLVALSTTTTNAQPVFSVKNQAKTRTFVVTQQGRVGIGPTAPAQALDVTGNIQTSGQFLGDGSALTGVPGVNSTNTYTGANTWTSTTTQNGLYQFGANAVGFGTLMTRQVFTSGTAATYTTPARARQLHVRMIGGGGAAGAAGAGCATGTTANPTIFNSINANGGVGGACSTGGGAGTTGGAGGTGGSGSASLRIPGQTGGAGESLGAETSGPGGSSMLGFGAASIVGGGNVNGNNAAANSGGGGSGAGSATTASAGGGGGEYVEIFLGTSVSGNLAATYTYTVSSGTVVNSSGATGSGGSGGSGLIIVDEYY